MLYIYNVDYTYLFNVFYSFARLGFQGSKSNVWLESWYPIFFSICTLSYFQSTAEGQRRVFFFYLSLNFVFQGLRKKRDVGPGLEPVWLLLEAGKAAGAKNVKIIFSSFLGFTSWHFNKNITVWETLKHLNFWQQKSIVKYFEYLKYFNRSKKKLLKSRFFNISKGWVAKHFNRGELFQCQPFLWLGWQVSPHQG